MKTEDLPAQFQTPGLLALSQSFVLWWPDKKMETFINGMH